MLISFVITTFNEMPHKLPVSVHSAMDQVFQDYELQVWHDGNSNQSYYESLEFIENFTMATPRSEDRVKFYANPERRGLTGYPMRQDALEQVTGDYVVFSNGDNYHTPEYLLYFAREVQQDPTVDLVYVNGLHNYANPGKPWTVLDSKPNKGAIDMAFFMTRTSLAREIGFTDQGVCGDGTFIDAAVARGAKTVKVRGDAVTVVHG